MYWSYLISKKHLTSNYTPLTKLYKTPKIGSELRPLRTRRFQFNQPSAGRLLRKTDQTPRILRDYKRFWDFAAGNSNNNRSSSMVATFFYQESASKNATRILSMKQHYLRWVYTHNLLYHFFYFNYRMKLWAERYFYKETLVGNWHTYKTTISAHRHLQPVANWKDFKYGRINRFKFNLKTVFNTDAIFVTNPYAFVKSLFHVKRLSVYTIGIVPASRDPLIVSYPITFLSDTAVCRLFFLRYLFNVRGHARNDKYNYDMNVWKYIHQPYKHLNDLNSIRVYK